jgi:hypothetical protein
MNRLTISHLAGAALGVSLWAAPAFADTGNLLVCTDFGFALQQCQLRDVALADRIVESGQAYEAQFLVRYDFPCSGHTVQLGVQSGDANKFFTMGATNALITLNGLGELHPYDPSPSLTRSLTFRPGCSLSISGVTVLPSTTTVQIWTNQAQSEARILQLSVNLYLLAKDYQNLSTWNLDKLNLLKTKLETLVASAPTNQNYKVMLNSVNSALQGQPPSATLDELRHAGDDVIATLRGELTQEVAVAQALVDRFARWQLAADQALAGALAAAGNA